MGCIGGRCRQALASPVPPAKRSPVSRPAPKLGAYRALIDAWLEADREAPRKQRHTAQADLAAAGRRARRRGRGDDGPRLRARAQARSWAGRSARCSCRRSTRPGAGAEVDWGEARGRARRACATTVHLFVMRASFSGAAFCQASLVETQQAFLELHVEAFEWFGGVFEQIRYDNLTSAVKQVLQGPPARRDRPLRRAALALPVRVAVHARRASRARTRRAASRARSAASAATTSSRSRRSRTLAELNALLLAGCEADLRAADRRARGDGRRGVGDRAAAAARVARRARSTRPRPRRRASTRSRWSRSARTATGRPRPIPGDGSTRSMTRSTAGTSWSGRGSWCAPIAARPASTSRPSPTSSEYGVVRLLDELAADLKDGRLASASRAPGVHPEARARGAAAAVDSRGPRSGRAGRREDRASSRSSRPTCWRARSGFARSARRTTRSRSSSMRRGRGRRWVVESDIANCFEAIPHDGLMSAIEERIVDRHLLKLLRAMLRAGVMEDGAVTRERDRHSAGRGDLTVAVQRLPAPARPAVGRARAAGCWSATRTIWW